MVFLYVIRCPIRLVQDIALRKKFFFEHCKKHTTILYEFLYSSDSGILNLLKFSKTHVDKPLIVTKGRQGVMLDVVFIRRILPFFLHPFKFNLSLGMDHRWVHNSQRGAQWASGLLSDYFLAPPGEQSVHNEVNLLCVTFLVYF